MNETTITEELETNLKQAKLDFAQKIMKEYENKKLSFEDIPCSLVSIFKAPLSNSPDYEQATSIDDIPSRSPSPSDIVNNKLVKETLINLMGQLTEKQQTVIKCRFGLINQPMTLQESGKVLKVSSERIRAIEAKAIRRLRLFAERYNRKVMNELYYSLSA